MIALHDALLCPTPKNALLGSAQTHATDLGSIITYSRENIKDCSTLNCVNEFPLTHIEAG